VVEVDRHLLGRGERDGDETAEQIGNQMYTRPSVANTFRHSGL
jgi:hypothetical protein